jgi:hypothetical protein
LTVSQRAFVLFSDEFIYWQSPSEAYRRAIDGVSFAPANWRKGYGGPGSTCFFDANQLAL